MQHIYLVKQSPMLCACFGVFKWKKCRCVLIKLRWRGWFTWCGLFASCISVCIDTHHCSCFVKILTYSGIIYVLSFIQGELGANAILAVSIAACRAGAAEKEVGTFWHFYLIFSHYRRIIQLYLKNISKANGSDICIKLFVLGSTLQTYCWSLWQRKPCSSRSCLYTN